MSTNVVRCQGAPADLVITTEELELDNSAGDLLAITNEIANVLQGGADS